jgi:hypothetical protein
LLSAACNDASPLGRARSAVARPCNGITEVFEPLVSNYLRRAGPLVAGAESETVLALENHGLPYKDLNTAQQAEIDLKRQHGARWRKEYSHPRAPGGAVFATSCEKSVLVNPDIALEQIVCKECRKICRDGAFRNIIRKPVPEAKNYRFTNSEYVPDALFSIYARCEAVHDIREDKVRVLLSFYLM